jgi:hypothetical protein
VMLGVALSTCATANALAFRQPATPEVDPSLAITALSLLGGTLAVLRVRHKK